MNVARSVRACERTDPIKSFTDEPLETSMDRFRVAARKAVSRLETDFVVAPNKAAPFDYPGVSPLTQKERKSQQIYQALKHKYGRGACENKDKKSLTKMQPQVETPNMFSRSRSRSTIKELSVQVCSPSKEFVKISEKLSIKMKKLKSYITKASRDFKQAKKALDSARSAALKLARSSSEQRARKQSADLDAGHQRRASIQLIANESGSQERRTKFQPVLESRRSCERRNEQS